jgi:hypothetical protein
MEFNDASDNAMLLTIGASVEANLRLFNLLKSRVAYITDPGSIKSFLGKSPIFISLVSPLG